MTFMFFKKYRYSFVFFFPIKYRDGNLLLERHKLHLYIVIFY